MGVWSVLEQILECGPVPNVMVALPNIGGALCSTPQSLASSSGRQPNFAALNRGRHLCSAGRPSRWALAHILVVRCFKNVFAHCIKLFGLSSHKIVN